jgi:two-component system chemotaxis response regulator CheB
VVQDPADTLYPGMPRSAIENVAVDHVIPIAGMGALLEQIAREPLRGKGGEPVSDELEGEEALSEMDLGAMGSEVHPGTPSSFACPDCGGTLWELSEGDLLRFRCRVGHAFTADALLVEQSDSLEAALWTALRALEERASLARHLADRSRRRGHFLLAERFDRQIQDADRHAAVIREALMNGSLLDPVTGDGEAISSDLEDPGGQA